MGCAPCSRDTGEEVSPAWATPQASGNWQAHLKPLKINPEALGGLPFRLQTMLCEPSGKVFPRVGCPVRCSSQLPSGPAESLISVPASHPQTRQEVGQEKSSKERGEHAIVREDMVVLMPPLVQGLGIKQLGFAASPSP